MRSYIDLMSRLGFGKFSKQNELNLDDFSIKHADYMTFYTNYLSYSEIVEIVKKAELRPSFKYTADFYWHKLRQLLGRDFQIVLGRRQGGVMYTLYNHFFKYVSSVTLFVEKENTYR